jgi:hypothetical protein
MVFIPILEGINALVPDPLSYYTNRVGGSNISSVIDIVSLVENVTVTKIDILAAKQLGIELKYSGDNPSPSIKANVSAINLDLRLIKRISDISKEPVQDLEDRELHSNMTNAAALYNQELDDLIERLSLIEQVGKTSSLSKGSVSINNGWKTPNKIFIDLSGNSSLFDAKLMEISITANR